MRGGEYNNMATTTTKPEVTGELIGMINRMITENPAMGRTELSRELCAALGWQSPGGQPKDIAARDMLRALDRAGRISLPPPRSRGWVAGRRKPAKRIAHDMEPIERPLAELMPVSLEPVAGGPELEEFKSLVSQFHYLGYDRTVGENMKYAARGRGGELLAVMLFGSAAWSCADRDAYIGWDEGRRRRGLQFMTNNQRFLIPGWVRVPLLASHALSLAERRISRDWEAKYGHRLAAMETFVEIGRFRGTCYRAANWALVGRTAGRGRDGGHHGAILPAKDIYLRPLCRHFREILKGETRW